MAVRAASPLICFLCLVAAAWLLVAPLATGFVSPSPQASARGVDVARASSKPVGTGKKLPVYGERDPLPKGYGIRTGLSDLLKPLNSEAGVTAKEESIGTYVVLFTAIVLLFLFYTLLLLINNQSVLLPPEDEFDEYVANFLPYFFFGEK
mmetsp:Transcript_92852/g.240371  ORF Transcript_92852/g.240371 Transcript_92852/m.240371 type:complete len:150 (-) Transcript_92852:273-722(-)